MRRKQHNYNSSKKHILVQDMASDLLETDQEINYYIVKENIERNIYEVVGRYNSDLEQALQHLRLFGSTGENDQDRLESDTKRLSYIGRAIIPVANMKALHPFSLQERTPIRSHYRSDPISKALECCYWNTEDKLNHMMQVAEKEHQIIMSARKISSTTESQSNIVYDREAFYNFSKQFARSLEKQEDTNIDHAHAHQPKRRRSSLLNGLTAELQSKIQMEASDSSNSAGEKRSAEHCPNSTAKNETHSIKHTASSLGQEEEGKNTFSPSKVFIENMDEMGKIQDGKGNGC